MMPPPLPALVGTAWLDGDADGIRGSAGNRTLNALEYNVGVGGVVATLVGCGDDADAGWSAKRRRRRRGGGTSRRTDVPGAGDYSFPIGGGEEGGRQFGWRTRRAKLLRDEGVAEDSWE